MRKLPFISLLALAVIPLVMGGRALRAGSADGAEVFKAICGECHAGGGNALNPAKTLKWESLEQNGKASLEAIKDQVSNGKSPMPAFKGILKEEQIEDVAGYVLQRAKEGW